MPSSEIMDLFRKRKLHSGGSGKIVTSPRQAKAIELSYARKEGHDIPKKPGLGARIARENKKRRAKKSE